MTRYMLLMELQVKLQKTAEITYLEANKHQTRYRLTNSTVLKEKKGTTDVLKAKEQHER